MKNEARLSRFLNAIWYGQNKLHYLLIPLSLIYLVLTWIRRQWLLLFTIRRRLPVPVVVVGGINVGGTGKTPLLIALVQWLSEQGCKPGIVSRGYRGERHRRPYAVNENDTADKTGDEPLLIKRKTSQAVFVSPHRYAAAVQLLKQHKETDVILADDGLQHYALPRDVEIAVVDGRRGLGNGWVLPAGPLREPQSRLSETDFVVVKAPGHEGDVSDAGFMQPLHGKASAREDDAKGVQPSSLDISRAPSRETETTMELVPQAFINLADAQAVAPDYFSGKTVHAMAGISDPQSFFNTLEQLGMMVIAHSFPDHHHFQPSDFELERDLPIIITEKDAVKCSSLPRQNKQNVWVLEIKTVLNQDFLTSLLRKIQNHRAQRNHG